MRKIHITLFFLLIFISSSCSREISIVAVAETKPVATSGDAADDPAIIINFKNPRNSLILGTDKKAGVYLYNLLGKELGFSKLGHINNIDVRQDNNEIYIAATNRSNQSIEFWVFDQEEFFNQKIDPFNIFNIPVRTHTIPSSIDLYGICIGLIGGTPVAFITEDKGPRVELWTLENQKLVGTFDNGGESEGCVFDDENQTLFISEEEVRGVLKAYNLNQEYPFEVPVIVDSREGNIGGDPEGVAIYKTSDTEGFLLLSSQGDNKYNVYNRQTPYEFIISFTIDDKLNGIDGTSETDGISVSHYNLRGEFSQGIMIAQDGYNFDREEQKNQNFKIVPFKKILKKINSK